VDEVWAFVAPKLVGAGPSPVGGRGVERIAEALQAAETTVERVGEDVLITVIHQG
jgi:diaminohydroxyphosphoribosylaminopyrimidine deaminase/5-amino-6-(5-phosphoribosylamino)uracil reductase